MNYTENLDDFLKLIHSYDEVILFPRGREGWLTLEFLRYTDFIKRICCVAAEKVDSFDNTSQKFNHFLPVIPLEYLLHFRESGVIIVAASSEFHERMDKNFTELGFQKVVFLNDETFQQIQTSLEEAYNSGQIMSWFMNHVMGKITGLEYRIDEQNEICAVNTKAFAEYRNRFLGQKIVLFATGPTSKYYKPIPDAIHVGVNFSWRREDIPLNYLFTMDGKINKPGEVQVEEGFDKVLEKVFVGIFSSKSNNTRTTFSENLSLKRNVCRFLLNSGNTKTQIIHQDILHNLTMDFGSITFPTLHFALFTYPKEIYLVGCDTTHTGHFYSSEKQDNMFTQKLKVGYARVKMFAKHFYPDTEIISINPVGLKGLFRDVYTDEYLASLNESKVEESPSPSGNEVEEVAASLNEDEGGEVANKKSESEKRAKSISKRRKKKR